MKGTVVVLMGVAGSGKSTVGRLLAEALGWPFFEGDDFHPPANVAKMAEGRPLTDEDRAPWLAALHDLIADHLRRGQPAVVACSALKESYRRALRQGSDDLRFFYLKGDFDTIAGRLDNRQGHFMKARMLRSQFETLEEPDPLEAPAIDIEGDAQEIAEIIRLML